MNVGSAEEAADYIAQMTAELALIAKSANLDLIAYFLEMAQLEAATLAQGPACAMNRRAKDVTKIRG